MVQPSDDVAGWYQGRADLVARFFEENADAVAVLCREAAQRFLAGSRLFAFGAGAAATDAQHVAVEFVHPVIVGKRALPAVALVNDAPTALGLAARDAGSMFARQLEILARPGDIAVGMTHAVPDPAAGSVAAALDTAGSMGLLTVALVGSHDPPAAAHAFAVLDEDPFVVQEVHETLYHVVWELVHVFFEHDALVRGSEPTPADDPGGAGFLYPFLHESRPKLDGVLAEVAGSVTAKARDTIELRRTSSPPETLAAAADAVAERLRAGGRVLAFGNGGSATDAEDLVVDLVAPPDGMRSVPALSLTHDAAVMTGVTNDVGFDNVFARQVIAQARDGDVAIAISTSGGSRNVLAAVEEARRRGLLTIGLAGYGGGRLHDLCDHTLVVHGDYVPRIQEAQATQYHCLRRLLETRLR